MNTLKIVLWLLNNQKDVQHIRGETLYLENVAEISVGRDSMTPQKKNGIEEDHQEYSQII